MDDRPTAHLGVARGELRQALRTLRRVTGKQRPPEALLSFEAAALVIRCGGTTVRARAWGRWPGVARASGHFVANFDRSLPDSDPVPVRVARGRLKIGRTGVECEWQSEVPDALRVPVDAGLVHLLRLPLEYDWEDIEAAGLSDLVIDAVALKETLLERAAKLMQPLEIGEADLAAFVEERIRRRFGLC